MFLTSMLALYSTFLFNCALWTGTQALDTNVCSAKPVKPIPRGYYCEATGNITKPNVIWQSQRNKFVVNGPDSYELCYSFCLQTPECLSLSISFEEICTMYGQTLTEMGFVYDQAGYTYPSYSSRHCFKSNCNSSQPSCGPQTTQLMRDPSFEDVTSPGPWILSANGQGPNYTAEIIHNDSALAHSGNSYARLACPTSYSDSVSMEQQINGLVPGTFYLFQYFYNANTYGDEFDSGLYLNFAPYDGEIVVFYTPQRPRAYGTAFNYTMLTFPAISESLVFRIGLSGSRCSDCKLEPRRKERAHPILILDDVTLTPLDVNCRFQLRVSSKNKTIDGNYLSRPNVLTATGPTLSNRLFLVKNMNTASNFTLTPQGYFFSTLSNFAVDDLLFVNGTGSTSPPLSADPLVTCAVSKNTTLKCTSIKEPSADFYLCGGYVFLYGNTIDSSCQLLTLEVLYQHTT